MFNRHKRLFFCIGLQIVAAVIGGSAAIASDQDPASVYANHHCTKYAPVVQVDPPNCTVSGWMPANTYQTPSVAQRDSNEIFVNAEQWWTIYLFDNFGGFYQYQSAYGRFGQSPGVNGVYTAALCASQVDTYGNCNTRWD